MQSSLLISIWQLFRWSVFKESAENLVGVEIKSKLWSTKLVSNNKIIIKRNFMMVTTIHYVWQSGKRWKRGNRGGGKGKKVDNISYEVFGSQWRKKRRKKKRKEGYIGQIIGPTIINLSSLFIFSQFGRKANSKLLSKINPFLFSFSF